MKGRNSIYALKKEFSVVPLNDNDVSTEVVLSYLYKVEEEIIKPSEQELRQLLKNLLRKEGIQSLLEPNILHNFNRLGELVEAQEKRSRQPKPPTI